MARFQSIIPNRDDGDRLPYDVCADCAEDGLHALVDQAHHNNKYHEQDIWCCYKAQVKDSEPLEAGNAYPGTVYEDSPGEYKCFMCEAELGENDYVDITAH